MCSSGGLDTDRHVADGAGLDAARTGAGDEMTRRLESADAPKEKVGVRSVLLVDEVDRDRVLDEWVCFRLDRDGDVDASDRSEYHESEGGEQATKAAAAAAAADERVGDNMFDIAGSLDPEVSSEAKRISKAGVVCE
mmetsp:Transcript_4531/g.14682  ORF Transcript_4531/g.14682 Transcript_4531/m.14682 type:complete len:137 (+) Transcript_4531:1264-1674(+)